MAKRRRIVFYHRTNAQNAQAILAQGFRDSTGYYMTTALLTGVWLSNVPLDENEGAQGEVLPKVSITLNKKELDYYEVKEEGKPYREWLFPASLGGAKLATSHLLL